jgi:hypothetical protein
VGFEPTETHKTSTVFETVPFVHSGILPGGRLAGGTAAGDGALLLKRPVARADATSVAGTNLFPDESEFTPRPAWQVIEAARRQGLTGELTLTTTPPTRVYLRDGSVYFAERSTDGTLAIRLLVEGVINREQMQRGTVIVNGVEHVGRMFEADPSIDRASVELCAELFTDDVMVDVANRVVSNYDLTLYKRHPSGIDRWYPHASNGSKPGDTVAIEPEPAPAPAAKPVVEAKPAEVKPIPEMPVMPDLPSVAEMPPPLPTPATAKAAEPVNTLNAPPITLAVPVTPGPLSTPPPPLVTQPLPITSLTTTSIPVIKPLAPTPAPAPVPAPVAAPVAPAATEADAAAIADEVAEAIKRAFSGLGAGA